MESLEELESALSTAIESVIRSHGVIPPSHESDDRYVALYGPQTGFMSLLALCSSPGTRGPGRPLTLYTPSFLPKDWHFPAQKTECDSGARPSPCARFPGGRLGGADTG